MEVSIFVGVVVFALIICGGLLYAIEMEARKQEQAAREAILKRLMENKQK